MPWFWWGRSAGAIDGNLASASNKSLSLLLSSRLRCCRAPGGIWPPMGHSGFYGNLGNGDDGLKWGINSVKPPRCFDYSLKLVVSMATAEDSTHLATSPGSKVSERLSRFWTLLWPGQILMQRTWANEIKGNECIQRKMMTEVQLIDPLGSGHRLKMWCWFRKAKLKLLITKILTTEIPQVIVNVFYYCN